MKNTASQIEEYLKPIILAIDPSASVSLHSEDNLNFFVQIDSQPSGAFIGYHGESISALQLVLSTIITKKFGKEIRVTINVADYEQQKQIQLEAIADKGVDRVRQTQSSYTFPSLSAKDRRYIHLYLSELSDLKTESVGEGEERRLVLFPQVNLE